MDWITELFHSLKEWLNPKIIIETLLVKGGTFVYVGLVFIVFAETGLAIGFFLPGDSLLVARSSRVRPRCLTENLSCSTYWGAFSGLQHGFGGLLSGHDVAGQARD